MFLIPLFILQHLLYLFYNLHILIVYLKLLHFCFSIRLNYSLDLLQEQAGNPAMWLSASEASSQTYEDVADRLHVDVRHGLSWQEATRRRQIAGY